MNITDFVNSLKLTLQDLEKTADVGYIKGITNIIVNGLNELDVSKRPIHCSDIKRETLYIKDNNAWEKEDQEKRKITRAIRHISIRNAKQIGEWTKENNGYNDSSNKKSDKYLKIVSEANGGEPEEINKIISNISNKVIIDKQV
jgi:flagellar motility protein MotE (MotC chaperone)